MKLTEKNIAPEIFLNETLRQMYLIYLENTINHFFVNWTYETFGEVVTTEKLYKDVWAYVVKNFQYKNDPEDELLTAPKYLISTKKGDCDDFALFIKTVLAIYGIKSNFLLCGKNENEFTHICVLTYDGYILDGTNNRFNFLDNDYKFIKVVK
ncbi:MAG: hypothetical protein GYA62_10005 [Bacteroidales bacterium]|nr:hypothetical protein [Bacteroidales bacterium]